MLDQTKSVTIYIASTEEYCYTSRSVVDMNEHKGCPCIDMMQEFYSKRQAYNNFGQQFESQGTTES